jgi:concentrative nucleoside transporter, CNT family
MEHLVPLLGIAFIFGVIMLFSKNRRAISWRIVGWGFGLQVLVALFVLRTAPGYWLMQKLSAATVWFLDFSFAGSRFVFGPTLGDPHGSLGMVFAFTVLPMIIYVAAVFSVLYYFRVLPVVVEWTAKVMYRIFGTSGAESLDVAASIVMDQTSAPLVIRPFLDKLTDSELLTIMTAGMAHISGSVLGAYVLFGAAPRDLLTAVVMTAPGTILISKMLLPETGHPVTAGEVKMQVEKRDVNILDAIAHGVTDGLYLALTIAAMLVAFVALIALSNGVLSGAHTSLQTLFGYGMAPIAWLLGVPWHDAMAVGNLMATKLVINEFVAFSLLGPLKGHIAARSYTIATYTICGFANFSSIGIQIGAIGSLAPSRKHDLARLGFRALLAGTLANYLSAAIVGLFLA